MPEQYGCCDRKSNCGYFNAPGSNVPRMTYKPQIELRKDVFIPNEILHQTLKQYEINTFIQNLLKMAPVNEVEKIISLYYLGTTKNGAISMPFIDVSGCVRAIQVKDFDHGNRTTNTTFLHSIIETYHKRKNEALPEWLAGYLLNESKVSCLFGEHLLKRYPSNVIALIEAPKGAIYGSLFFGSPEDPTNFLWLAVYNLSSLTLKKCMALKGREVVLFPDLSKTGHAFDLWSKRADEFNTTIPGATFRISDLLEVNATPEQRERGLDLADYLTQFDLHKFKHPPGAQLCNKKELVTPEIQPAHDEDDLILRPGINYSLPEIVQAMKRINPSVDPLKSLERITNDNPLVHWCKINREVYVTPF